jgi:hypothetical protein
MTKFENSWGIHTGEGLAQKQPKPIGKRVTLLPMSLGYFQAKPSPVCIPQLLSNLVIITYLPMKMEQTERSETSAYKIQTPGNYPEEIIQRTEHSKSFKSRKLCFTLP